MIHRIAYDPSVGDRVYLHRRADHTWIGGQVAAVSDKLAVVDCDDRKTRTVLISNLRASDPNLWKSTNVQSTIKGK